VGLTLRDDAEDCGGGGKEGGASDRGVSVARRDVKEGEDTLESGLVHGGSGRKGGGMGNDGGGRKGGGGEGVTDGGKRKAKLPFGVLSYHGVNGREGGGGIARWEEQWVFVCMYVYTDVCIYVCICIYRGDDKLYKPSEGSQV
jgi:hypothetical protein